MRALVERHAPHAIYSPTAFRPEVENPGAPRLALAGRLALGAGEQLVALAASPSGKLALLCWRSAGDAFVLIEDE